MKPFFLAPLFLALAASLPAAPEPFTTFKDGETYVYRVGWGILTRAGEIVIAANQDTHEGREVMRITTQTSSRGLVRGLYRYDDRGEVVIDRATSRLLYTKEESEDRRRRTESRTDFDYEAGVARHRDTTRPHRNTDLPIPEEGAPLDLISSLVAPREWNLKPGDKRDLLVHFGREFFLLTLHAEEVEEVSTPMGTFKALRIVPRMDKEPPRGVFARGGEIKVWISQDDTPLPVRMQLSLKYGTATLLLQEHTVAKNQPKPATVAAD